MDKNGKIIGYYVTGTKLFAEDFEADEDRDVVPKNFILIKIQMINIICV